MFAGQIKTVATCIILLAITGAAEAQSWEVEEFPGFSMEFVTIPGSDVGYQCLPNGYCFIPVEREYRIGMYEVSAQQWRIFEAAVGVPITGSPSSAYQNPTPFSGFFPASRVSWLEAAQFVNWLNTSQGYQPAYNFTGTQGTEDYTFALWGPEEAANMNPFRHKNAHYFLPTEDEWVQAAYFNFELQELQQYATWHGDEPMQGESNFASGGPRPVYAGAVELNGTFNMMGNVWEWLESPMYGDYMYIRRAVRGGAYHTGVAWLSLEASSSYLHDTELPTLGFRVASVPEPTALTLLALSSIAILRRRRT